MANWFEKMPSVNDLLEAGPLKNVLESMGRQRVVVETARFLDRVRSEAQAAAQRVLPITPQELAQRVARWISTSGTHAPQLVINATGVFFSPELSAAPLAAEASDALTGAAQGWQADDGWRAVWEALLQKQIGCEAATLFTTSSAALLNSATVLAGSQTVVMARGEMERDASEPSLLDLAPLSGVRIHEVGSVNHTSLADYEASLTNAGLILVQSHRWTHIAGSSQRPAAEALIGLAHRYHVPILFDLGWSGFYDVARFGWQQITQVRQLMSQGADLVLLRGHGLIGGPPCAIVAGRQSLVEKIISHPFAQATAASHFTQAALAATLKLYENPTAAEMAIPLLALLSTTEENLKQRAERLAPQISACAGVALAEAVTLPALLHSGQPVEQALPSWGIRIQPAQGTAADLANKVLCGAPAILGSANENAFLLNLRTVLPRDDMNLVDVFTALAASESK
jgi:L-seryl-tRNA(Ser) seleniumtransferase